MALQSLIRIFLPKDDRFFTLLEEHAAVMAEAATVMTKLPLGNGTAHAALEEVHRLEHRGDELVRKVNLALEATFVTPIDREDIHNLTTKLDDVLDYLYAAGQAFVTYDVRGKTPAMEQMLELLAEATVVLRDTVPKLRLHKLDEVAPARLAIVAIEKRQDDLYRAEMAQLFKNPTIDAKDLMRQKVILDALEEALDSCQDAADVLENIAVKHA